MRYETLKKVIGLGACAVLAACAQKPGPQGKANIKASASSNSQTLLNATYKVEIWATDSKGVKTLFYSTDSINVDPNSSQGFATAVLPCDATVPGNAQAVITWSNAPAVCTPTDPPGTICVLNAIGPWTENFTCEANGDYLINASFHADTVTSSTGFTDINVHFDQTNTDLSCKSDCDEDFAQCGTEDADIFGLAAYPSVHSDSSTTPVVLFSLLGGAGPTYGNSYPSYLDAPVTSYGPGSPGPKFLNSSVGVNTSGSGETAVQYGLAVPGPLGTGVYDIPGGIIEYTQQGNTGTDPRACSNPAGQNNAKCTPLPLLETCGDNSAGGSTSASWQAIGFDAASSPAGGLIILSSASANYDTAATTSWNGSPIAAATFLGGTPTRACGLCAGDNQVHIEVDVPSTGTNPGSHECIGTNSGGKWSVTCATAVGIPSDSCLGKH